jgi:ABC-type glutathione transport system ATPase component
MHRGSIVEIGPTENVLERPQHPYTRTLLSAALSLTPGGSTHDFTTDEARAVDAGVDAHGSSSVGTDAGGIGPVPMRLAGERSRS